jgi:hypothetical protein
MYTVSCTLFVDEDLQFRQMIHLLSVMKAERRASGGMRYLALLAMSFVSGLPGTTPRLSALSYLEHTIAVLFDFAAPIQVLPSDSE